MRRNTESATSCVSGKIRPRIRRAAPEAKGEEEWKRRRGGRKRGGGDAEGEGGGDLRGKDEEEQKVNSSEEERRSDKNKATDGECMKPPKGTAGKDRISR